MTRIPTLSLDLPDIGAGETAGVFAVFDQQDSGCLSYGANFDERRFFVKTSTTDAARRSLLNAIEFHEAVEHPAIVHPEQATKGNEVTLVYPWIDGLVLNHATVGGSDRSQLARFRSLPVPVVERAISTVLDAHAAVSQSGFVSVDFYDGAMLYDFENNAMHLIDLDEYRPGPFVVQVDRLPGSRTYMAPEEWSEGATIDERTMVFTMGKAIQQLLKANTGQWRGTQDQKEVAAKATELQQEDRYQSLASLMDDWEGALAP